MTLGLLMQCTQQGLASEEVATEATGTDCTGAEVEVEVVLDVAAIVGSGVATMPPCTPEIGANREILHESNL